MFVHLRAPELRVSAAGVMPDHPGTCPFLPPRQILPPPDRSEFACSFSPSFAVLQCYSKVDFMLMRLSQIMLFRAYSHSPTGSWLIACRKTGSTFVYTSFVSCGLECSNSR